MSFFHLLDEVASPGRGLPRAIPLGWPWPPQCWFWSAAVLIYRARKKK